MLWRGQNILRQIFIHCTYKKDYQKRQHGVSNDASMSFGSVVFRTGAQDHRIIRSAQALYVSLHSTTFLDLMRVYGDPQLDEKGNSTITSMVQDDDDEKEEQDEEEDEEQDEDEDEEQDEAAELILEQQQLKHLYMMYYYGWVRNTRLVNDNTNSIQNVDREIHADFGPMPMEINVSDSDSEEEVVAVEGVVEGVVEVGVEKEEEDEGDEGEARSRKRKRAQLE